MKLDNINSIKEYEIIREKDVNDLNSKGLLLKHKKTGARIFVLSNDDDNKVFYIGFRTPPYDSTGLPHIMEHSVLCGSKKFPAKDPFIELAKGSLNTFLNAMTYPDKTVYPIASCNDKDFQNLMDVYLDAVFNPNIYSREQIFKQEGWHYEIDDKDSEIKINGVVYNEMKGAFSSPDDSFEREVFNTLYPDTAYSYESGGDPDVIPELKYNDFLDFHRKYYHPSNSFIYLYGDMDVVEKLKFIDEEYLSKYDAIDIDSTIGFQKPFEKTKTLVKEYGIGSEESEDNNTYLSYNIVAGTSLDKNLYVALQILEYVLLDAPGAVLSQALLDKEIGSDIQSSLENGIFQPYFSIIAKNAEESQLEDFMSTITKVLKDLVKNGIDKKALMASINCFEFQYREADFGSHPKGLLFGLQALDSWLYDENEPFMHIEATETYAFLRQQIGTGYFENIIQKYFLDNPHSSIVVYKPKRGLTSINDQKLKDKLAEYKNSLSKEEIDFLVKDTIELHEYQEEPSTKEELESIPMLSIEDIKREAKKLTIDKSLVDNTELLTHDIFTNGIGYLNLAFKITDMSDEQYKFLGILKNVLGYVSTKNFSYNELANEINENCGGISFGAGCYADYNDYTRYQTFIEIRAKMFDDKLGFVFDIIKEILTSSNYKDDKRMRELIGMLKSRMQSSLLSSGHTTAAARAMAHIGQASYEAELFSGIEFLRFVEQLDADFDNNKEMLYSGLEECISHIFRPENLMVDYTSTDCKEANLEEKIVDFKKCLYTSSYNKGSIEGKLLSDKEAFKSAAKVQYVAVAGNYKSAGLEYTGALRVLKVILGYDYLWNNVRVKGGAYGCMSSFLMSGNCYFTSYRDPNLSKTLDIYKNAPDYISDFSPDDRDMVKYIIGAISALDTPLTPCDEGARSRNTYLCGITYDVLQAERLEIIECTKENIRSLSKHVEAVLSKNVVCVVGSEDAITEASDIFTDVQNLYSE